MNYKSWLMTWLGLYIAPSRKPKTLLSYQNIVKSHIVPSLGERELSSLTPVLLQRFIAERLASGNQVTGGPLSASTVGQIVTVLHGSLSCACRAGLIKSDPSKCLSRPHGVEQRAGCFTAAEQQKIVRAVLSSGRAHLFGIVLCLYTGVRLGELLALRWEDIDFRARTLTVDRTCRDGKDGEGNFTILDGAPKTPTSARLIPLPRQIVRLLRELRRGSGCAFVVSHNKRRISPRSYQRMFERLLSCLHIGRRGFHALRHTFATRAVECGMDVRTLSELLGHRSPAVTLRRYVYSVLPYKVRMMNKLGEAYFPKPERTAKGTRS